MQITWTPKREAILERFLKDHGEKSVKEVRENLRELAERIAVTPFTDDEDYEGD